MGRSRLHLLLILNQTCSRILRIVLRPGAYLVDTIPWLDHLPWYAQVLKREFEKH
ncbi:hypothetical protein BDR03DRAFT_945723 [Suillus americanus]|nr:hypothetical protein BDR03DRAFT_945723 [Suillus americanus]